MAKWNKDTNIRNAGHWLAHKIELIELKEKQISSGRKITALRGAIYNVELGMDNIGSEKNKKRPCLVISNNKLNSGDTVIVIPLSTHFPNIVNTTTGEMTPRYKNHFILHTSTYPFLSKDSAVKCEDIRVIDKIRLCELLGNLSPTDLNKIKNCLRYSLDF